MVKLKLEIHVKDNEEVTEKKKGWLSTRITSLFSNSPQKAKNEMQNHMKSELQNKLEQELLKKGVEADISIK